MSLDDADIIQAAEDHIGLLQEALRSSAEHVHRQVCPDRYEFDACPLEWCEKARGLLVPFMRPGCDLDEESGERQCDDDCDGFHDWMTDEVGPHVDEPAGGHMVGYLDA